VRASRDAAACDLFAELGRSSQKLIAVAPRLRARGAGAVVETLLNEDAVPAAARGDAISARGSRRLFDRLVALAACASSRDDRRSDSMGSRPWDVPNRRSILIARCPIFRTVAVAGIHDAGRGRHLRGVVIFLPRMSPRPERVTG
jgi:Protein of unknown function (DUF1403)